MVFKILTHLHNNTSEYIHDFNNQIVSPGVNIHTNTCMVVTPSLQRSHKYMRHNINTPISYTVT